MSHVSITLSAQWHHRQSKWQPCHMYDWVRVLPLDNLLYSTSERLSQHYFQGYRCQAKQKDASNRPLTVFVFLILPRLTNWDQLTEKTTKWNQFGLTTSCQWRIFTWAEGFQLLSCFRHSGKLTPAFLRIWSTSVTFASPLDSRVTPWRWNQHSVGAAPSAARHIVSTLLKVFI